MGVALICCILCGLGLVDFKWAFLRYSDLLVSFYALKCFHRSEADADKLYHPQDSDYLKNQVLELFPGSVIQNNLDCPI